MVEEYTMFTDNNVDTIAADYGKKIHRKLNVFSGTFKQCKSYFEPKEK